MSISYSPGGKMSWVSLEAAMGTMIFALIPLLSPSMANVLVNPSNPALAALKYTDQKPRSTFDSSQIQRGLSTKPYL